MSLEERRVRERTSERAASRFAVITHGIITGHASRRSFTGEDKPGDPFVLAALSSTLFYILHSITTIMRLLSSISNYLTDIRVRVFCSLKFVHAALSRCAPMQKFGSQRKEMSFHE